jgi:hypothetical protein
MPFRRTVNITGLSTSDPLPGTPSEIDFTPGSPVGGVVVGPVPTIALYADVPSSITEASGLVSAWGIAAAAGGARPELTSDSVSSHTIVRTKSGTKVTFPAGACDFASQGPVTFVLGWRQRNYTGSGSYILFDTTNGGTTAGVQIVAIEPISSLGRQLLARVYNGSTWIIDRDLQLPNQAYQALIWTVSVIVITSTSLTIYADGYAWLELTFAAITFPAGAASPGVLGCSPDDWFAFEIWNSAFSEDAAYAATTRIRSRFSLPYSIVRIFSDDKSGETQPSACLLSDDTYIAMATQNPGPGDEFTNGVIQMRTSPDGYTWTPDPGLTIPTANGLQLPFTPGAGVGLIEPCVTQLSNGVILATCSEGTASRVRCLRAASPAAARANTWTNEIVITQGTPILDDCASNVTEDPANPGHVYCCVYRQLTGEAFSSACFYKSTNYGLDGFPTLVKFANGVTDSIDYQEPGLAFVPAAGAAKYSDLTTGQFLFLVRDSGSHTMWEFTATSAAGPWTRRATNIAAYQCARFQFLQDGTYLVLCRDATNGFGMIYRRKGVVTGTAIYTANPEAIAPFPTWQTVSGSGNLGQGGNICEEVDAGVMLVVGATRLDLYRCDTYARFWPEKQLYGQMLIVVSPSTVAGKNAGDTVQFSALGAGDFVWSLQTNASGGTIGSSTGLYTAGSTTGTDVVRCTDLNGYFDTSEDVSISVTGSAPTSPWLLSSCLLWVEPSSIQQSGGNLTSWQDKTSHANHFIQGGATAVPVSGSTVTTGSGAYLKSTNDIALGRFTTVAKLATSAVGQIAYHDFGPSGGNYWYTSSPSAYIARVDGTQSLYSTNFSLGVRDGSQVVAGLTFAGAAASAKLTLAGVDQTMTSATGDLGTNTDTGKMYVGADNTGGDNLAAAYTAFGVFDSTISPSELAAVYAYMATL